MRRITVWSDETVQKQIIPILRREGMTLSSFVRKAMLDYLEAHTRRDSIINIDEVEGLR